MWLEFLPSSRELNVTKAATSRNPRDRAGTDNQSHDILQMKINGKELVNN